jgi:hypothetical protein
MSLLSNEGGKAMFAVVAIVVSIIIFFLVSSLTWMFPIEIIKLLQYLTGALVIMSLLVIW